MLFVIHGIFWFIVSLILRVNGANFEVIPQRTESIPGTKKTVVDFSKWRVSRIKTDYLFNGEFTINEDMDNNYTKTYTSAYSALGNNQFIAQPFKLPMTPMCKYFNTSYKKYLMPSFEGHSDFPVIPPEGLCPIPKGTYHTINMELKVDRLPDNIPSGLWKVEDLYYQNNEFVGGVVVYAIVSPLIN